MNVLQDVRELQETRKEHELGLAKSEKLMEASILDTQQLKLEMRLFRDEMNRRWGELANKMGTLVEDIVYPGLPLALKRRFDLEVDVVTHNMSVKDPETGSKQEFDVIATCGDWGFVVDVNVNI